MGHGLVSNNAAVLRQLTKSLRVMFRKEIENPTVGFDMAMKWFMEVNSTGDSEDYNWLGAIPAMEKWIDGRPHSKLSQFGQTITNHDYANGIEIPLNWIDDDKLGQAEPRIKQLTDGYYKHVFREFLSLITNGSSTVCYDGKNFFATDHEEGDSGVQSNYASSGGTLTADNVEARYAAMTELVDDTGELLHITPTHLAFGSSYRTAAHEIIVAPKLANGADNPNAGLLEPLLIPGFGTSPRWMIVDMSSSMRPFIKQNRRKLDFHAKDQPSDQMVYDKRIAQYGADYRGGYGYGFWQTVFLSDGV